MSRTPEELKDMAQQVSELVDKGMEAIEPQELKDGTDMERGFCITQSVLFSMLLHNLQTLSTCELIASDDCERLITDVLKLAEGTRNAIAKQFERMDAKAKKPHLKVVH